MLGLGMLAARVVGAHLREDVVGRRREFAGDGVDEMQFHLDPDGRACVRRESMLTSRPMRTVVSGITSASATCSGVVMGENRSTTLPCLSTRNFSKFQVISALSPSPGCSVLSHAYSGAAPSPLTSILLNIGKVTSYFDVANSRISASEPGSCAPNWLHGKPSTVTSSLSS